MIWAAYICLLASITGVVLVFFGAATKSEKEQFWTGFVLFVALTSGFLSSFSYILDSRS